MIRESRIRGEQQIMSRERAVTESTREPHQGCQCIEGRQAHLSSETGADETATAPVMFLVKREGKLLQVCPSCVHVATDLVLARLYNRVMDLQPFVGWHIIRFTKLLEFFRFALPVEEDFYKDEANLTAKAQTTYEAIQRTLVEGLRDKLLAKLRGAVPKTSGDELEAALMATPTGKFRES